MTALQAARAVSAGRSLRSAVAPPPADSWAEAPAPGQVGYRFLRGMLQRDLPPSQSTRLTNAVHWLYGTACGGLYGLVEGTADARPLLAGPALGSLVFGNAYVALPAMGLYDPPWEYDAKTLGIDWTYHLGYGMATAIAFHILRPRRSA